MTTAFLTGDIERDEGCVLRAYQDTVGVWTIGVGHTGPDVHKGLIWTQAQADAQLAQDIGGVVHGLDTRLPWWRKLNDGRQDVLVNMGFNLGVDGLLSFHHTLDATEEAAYAQAAADMLLTQPWRRQVGDRAVRLAAQMKSGARATPKAKAA